VKKLTTAQWQTLRPVFANSGQKPSGIKAKDGDGDPGWIRTSDLQLRRHRPNRKTRENPCNRLLDFPRKSL
jgi:hypothetical protein